MGVFLFGVFFGMFLFGGCWRSENESAGAKTKQLPIPAKAGISRLTGAGRATPGLHRFRGECGAGNARTLESGDSRFRGNGGRGESGNLPVIWGGAGNACTAPLITCRGKPLPAFFATPESHALPLRCRCRRRQFSASPSGRCICRSRSN